MLASVACAFALALAASPARSFTVYSTDASFGGPGIFYGPGRFNDVPIFSVVIRNVSFTSEGTFVTPFFNNGALEPNVAGEIATDAEPDGLFSDGKTPINENADVGAFDLNGMPFLVGIAKSGHHSGEQVSVLLDDHLMIMTMDIVFDMGVGEGGIVSAPFYGTTSEVTIPPSLQTQYGIAGGIDQAGSLRPGDTLRGRLGDFDRNGMLDGAIVVAGNLPLNSIFMPGAPYALIRYFETDMPYDGEVIGKLPGDLASRAQAAVHADFQFPADEAKFVKIDVKEDTR